MVSCRVCNKQLVQQFNIFFDLCTSCLLQTWWLTMAFGAHAQHCYTILLLLIKVTVSLCPLPLPPHTLLVIASIGLHTHYPDWCFCEMQDSADPSPTPHSSPLGQHTFA